MGIIVMNRDVRIEQIEILTETDAAKYIGMSRSFLNADRSNGLRIKRTKGPVFLKLGRAIRYRKTDLDNWLQQNLIVR